MFQIIILCVHVTYPLTKDSSFFVAGSGKAEESIWSSLQGKIYHVPGKLNPNTPNKCVLIKWLAYWTGYVKATGFSVWTLHSPHPVMEWHLFEGKKQCSFFYSNMKTDLRAAADEETIWVGVLFINFTISNFTYSGHQANIKLFK